MSNNARIGCPVFGSTGGVHHGMVHPWVLRIMELTRGEGAISLYLNEMPKFV